MNRDSRAYEQLRRAHDTFVSAGQTDDARAVSKLIEKLSGGCTATNHTWPTSGPWCYCGRERWRS